MPIQPPSKAKKIGLIILACVAGLVLISVVFAFISSSYLGVSGGSMGQGGVSLPNSLGAPSVNYSGSLAEKSISGTSVSDTSSLTTAESQLTEKKIIKNGVLSLLVKSADQTAADMQGIAERLGGFVSASDVYQVLEGTKTGSVTIRVPADRFNQALDDTKKLAIKVERENVNAQDVTEQYIDLESRLKNLQAQEEQYLTILKQAVKIADILQVTAQLDQVRMQIEQTQGQLKYLSRQVDMASISANLTEEADVQVFGLRWRPLVVVKQAFRDMLTGLQAYVDSMIKLIFSLPSVLAWLITIGLIILIGWKILHWIWQRFLKPKTL